MKKGFPGCESEEEIEQCVPNLVEINKECLLQNDQLAVRPSGGELKVPANFVYEEVPTKNWNFLVGIDNAGIRVTNIIEGKIGEQESNNFYESSLSTDNCKYYAFNYLRNNPTLIYDIPLKSEDVDLEGRKSCIYSLTDEIIKTLELIPGRAIQDLDQICPDLQRGRKLQDGSAECPSQAECRIQISPGSVSVYGYTFEKDDCGNVKVVPDNSGNSIGDWNVDSLNSDVRVDEIAKNFIDKCMQNYVTESIVDPVETGVFFDREFGSAQNLYLSEGYNRIWLRLLDNDKSYNACDESGTCFKTFYPQKCDRIREVRQILKKDGNVILEKVSTGSYGCAFISDFDIPSSYIGNTLSLSAEVRLSDGSVKKFDDIKSANVHEDLAPPNVIRGTYFNNQYTTLPANFFFLAIDNVGVSGGDLMLKTNIGEFDLPLSVEKIYGNTYMLKAQWNPQASPSSISVFPSTIELTDINGNTETQTISGNLNLLDDRFNCRALRQASKQKPINVVFVTHGFSQADIDGTNFNSLYEALLSKYPFSKYANHFSFYLLSSHDWNFEQSTLDNDYYSLIYNKCGLGIDDIHEVVKLVKKRDRSHATSGTQELFVLDPMQLPQGVYIHETGHSLED